MIRCRTLGPVEVTVDGGPAPPELLWRKHLALLVYLACTPRRGRTRDQLVGLLWADRTESQGRHSLNEALRVIRRVAGTSALTTSGGRVRLADATVKLDLDDFERLLGAGRPGDAAALCTGNFLEGFAVPGATEFEDWLAGERLRWCDRMVEALVLAGETRMAQGELAVAAEMAQQALRVAPFAEPALRLVMSALALRGDRAGALERHATFITRLRETLQAEPAAETSALAGRIRAQRELQRSHAGSSGEPTRRVPLIGREKALATLVRIWEEGRTQGRAKTAVLLGDPGVGKTRLAEELLGRVRLGGGQDVSVRMIEGDAGENFSALLGLARGGLLDCRGVAAADPAAINTLAGHLAQWRERFPTTSGAPMPLAAAFREVVRAAALESPVALFVDDAQWIDHDSWLALAGLPRDLAEHPLLLLLAATRDPAVPTLDQLRARIPRDCPGAVVTLGPLGPDHIRRLARGVLPSYSEQELDRVARRIATDSAGLPLLAVELLHAVALGLDLAETRGAWPAPLRTLTDTLPSDLPDAVVAALRVGYRRLTPAAQQVLTAAAVLNERVTPGDLARATGLPGSELTRALDELEWQRWLDADGRGYAYVARIARAVVDRDMVSKGQRERIRTLAAGR